MSEAARPLVTFALFAFNQETYIRDAIEAALAQDYSPLEIILSDDCSTDRTYEVMEMSVKDYSGPHRVLLNRNTTNLGANGIGAHVNKVVEMASGELFVFAAGDDISDSSRVSKIVNMWVASEKPTGSIHSAVEAISDDPRVSGRRIGGCEGFGEQSLVECIASGAKGLLGASHAITRNVFEIFGPLPASTYFEDRTLAFRSLLAGSVLYCPEALVKYRVSDDSLCGQGIYDDSARWERFYRGTVATYASFHDDYVAYKPRTELDRKVLKKIDEELARIGRTRWLTNTSPWKRAIAAYYFTHDAKSLYHRLSFILNQAGLGKKAFLKFATQLRGRATKA